MSYEPTVWKTGDIVSSEKLNKLENGVVNSGGGSGVKVLMFDVKDHLGFAESADTYYSFGEIKNMLIEDPNQILAYLATSGFACMPTVPVFVPAGTTNNDLYVTPDVDTIYLSFLRYNYGGDSLVNEVIEYTEEDMKVMEPPYMSVYSLTRQSE